MKQIASVIFLIFPPKTLIWNKIVLPASESSNVLELMENELKKFFSESI